MEYLALDLGAGSGRAIVGRIEDNRISLEEIHRFQNRQVRLGDTLYWDFPALFAEIKLGISKAVQKGYNIKSVAVDTWGVDFGLLDIKGKLLSNPVCYRDTRTSGILDEVFRILPGDYLYSITGNQFMEINTAFQLLSMRRESDPQLMSARNLLFIPDLINYFLTGFIGNEYTIASTSQLLNARQKTWEDKVFEALDIPRSLMSDIVYPGSVLGTLRKDIASETGAGPIDVVAVGSHDTASAVAAIPATGEDWAYLSSGTWSLMGIESDQAIMNHETLIHNFTNEGGVGGKIRFLRNMTGLWLLQNIMTEWEQRMGQIYVYEQLLTEAGQAIGFNSLIDPDEASFTNPISMQEAMNQYCIRTNQAVPGCAGEYVRMILRSLANKYGAIMAELKQCTGYKINRLYVVGGGSRNEILNQLTANTLGIPVIKGHEESTAIGNIIMQAIARKEIRNLEEGRKIVASSIKTKQYDPKQTEY